MTPRAFDGVTASCHVEARASAGCPETPERQVTPVVVS